VAACLAAFAARALACNELRQAGRLFGAAEALSESIHEPLLPEDAFQVRRNVAVLRERLDAATLNAAWAEGRAMTLDQAVAYALETAPGSA
jgi:hypothetical protein